MFQVRKYHQTIRNVGRSAGRLPVHWLWLRLLPFVRGWQVSAMRKQDSQVEGLEALNADALPIFVPWVV